MKRARQPRLRLPLWLCFAGALAVQAVLSRVNLHAPDFFAILLVHAALTRGRRAATATGAAAGLAADTLSGGLFGLHAFTGTLIGYLMGLLGRVLVTDTLAARAALLAGGALARPAGAWALENVFRHAAPPFTPAGLFLNAAVTAAAGLAVLHLLERLEIFLERRRYGR